MTASATSMGAARGQLLLVDADAAVRDALRAALESEGFAVCPAGLGASAVHRYAAGLFDLVLMDIGASAAPGWELLRQLRGVNPKVGVVVLTVRTDLRAAATAAGVLAVCEKPMAVASLVDVLRRLLAEGESRADHPGGPPVYLATG